MTTWLASFLTAYVGQAAAYLTLAGGLFLLTHRWGARWLARRRIRLPGRRLDRAQLLHELRHTAVVLAVGTAQALLVAALRDRGLATIPDSVPPGGTLGAAGALVALILLNDLWFYVVHRLLHTPWLFRWVHAVHHRSVDVDPLSSYSFHVVEAALLTGWIVPAVLVVPLPLPVLMAAQAAGLANNLMAHLGYELLPAWWTRAPGLRWSNSATFHALHHARYRGNYGLFTRVWDRMLGTEIEGYEAAFAAAHGGASTEAEGGGDAKGERRSEEAS
jgi:sterol desaturase/sphingolipid hydroxylase (fatty acid hydroxylase superfamily)